MKKINERHCYNTATIDTTTIPALQILKYTLFIRILFTRIPTLKKVEN